MASRAQTPSVIDPAYDNLLSQQQRKARDLLLAHPNELIETDFLLTYCGSRAAGRTSETSLPIARWIVNQIRDTLDAGDIIAVPRRGYVYLPKIKRCENAA